MPEFSDALKQKVKAMDGFRYQICGRGPEDGVTLEVHHWRENRGMGGKESVNTPENLITLCRPCHLKFSGPGMPWRIVAFDRDKGIMEVIDGEGRKVDHKHLWFHRKALAEKLQPIEARIQGLHMIDGKIASDLYELYRDDNYQLLDPDAKSFRDYAGSRGWDSGRAMRLIKLWEKALELGIEWPPQMTASDFRKQLQDAGEIKPQAYWYIIIKPNAISASPARIVRTDDPEMLIASLKPTEAAARVGKWFGIKAKAERLTDLNGFEVPFTRISVDESRREKENKANA